MNSSFSPRPARSWDCTVNSDGFIHLSNESSFSSRDSRRRIADGSYATHNHSVSDGAALCSESPHNYTSGTLWTSPMANDSPLPGFRVQKTKNSYFLKKRLPGFQSPNLEQTQSESHKKWPFSRSNQSYVHPSTSCVAPTEDQSPSSSWTVYKSSMEYKFHKAIKELQKMEQSQKLGFSSRREGFDNDSPCDADILDCLNSPSCLMTDQNCSICGKLLTQRSPFSSDSILRGTDVPTVGVLACSHVFHADCLEQVTHKGKAHDPSCPVCSNCTESVEEMANILNPKHIALRNLQKNKWIPNRDESWSSRRSRSKRVGDKDSHEQDENSNKSFTSQLKKHISFKGKGISVPYSSSSIGN